MKVKNNSLAELIDEQTREFTLLKQELQKKILEKSRVEDELRASEERYRLLVENVNSIILCWDTQGNIIFFNEYAQKFFDYREDEIIGKNVMETIVPRTETSGRDLQNMIDNLCLNPNHYTYNENENIRKNGERVWVAWTNKAILNKSSKITEILSVGADITARKKAETELARRADELQTLLTVQQAITSRLDPDDVLHLVADEARRLTSARRATVFVKEGDYLRISVLSGEDHSNMLGYRMLIKDSLTGQSLSTGKPVRIADVTTEPHANQDAIMRSGIKSFISVPLISGTQPIGAITVVDKQDGIFEVEDERILVMLASGAIIGLENARLYREEQERHHEDKIHREVAEGLSDILAILNSNRPLPEILDFILHQAGRFLGTETGALYRLQADQGILAIQAAKGLPDGYVAGMYIPVGSHVVGRAVMERQPITIPDMSTVLPSTDDLTRRPEPQAKYLAWLIKNYHGIIAVPLIGRNEVYGGIVLYFPEVRLFSKEELDLAMSFANQAVLAIENAQLRSQAEETAIAAERNRLARDLHDAVTQTLFSASLIAEVLPRIWEKNVSEGKKRLEELRQLSRGALAEMRTLLLELRPATLVEVSLNDLLRQLAEAAHGRSRIPVALNIPEQYVLPADVQIAFYRIAQEALNNIIKHSETSSASLSLRKINTVSPAEEIIELIINDNGKGFDLMNKSLEHLGLKIMKERAAGIGADLQIKSRIGKGTEVLVRWSNSKGGYNDGERCYSRNDC